MKTQFSYPDEPRYLQRDVSGNVVGHFSHPHPYAQERVAVDHPDVVAWNTQHHLRHRMTPLALLLQRIASLEDQVAILSRRDV